MSLIAALGAVAVAIPAAYTLAPVAVIQLARKEAFNVLIKPGNGVMILKGDEFEGFEISTPLRHLNRPDAPYFNPGVFPWQILDNGDHSREDFDLRPKWMQDNGLFPLGFPGKRRVSEEWFEWKEDMGGVITHRTEKTKIFKVNVFPYVVEQTGIMTKDQLLVKLTYVLGLKIINPYLALIATEDWLVQVLALAQQQTRNWAASFNFLQLISQTDGKTKKERHSENFLALLKELNGALALLGVELCSAELITTKPDGAKSAEYLDYLNKPFQAQKEAEALVIKTAAQAEATIKTGLAQAQVDEALAKAKAAGEFARYKAAQDYPQGAAIVNDVFAGAFTTSINSLLDAVTKKIGS